MIVPPTAAPTTPAPATDAPEALGDFAAALAETELAVLHALMGHADGGAETVDAAPVDSETREETPAPLVSGAEPILPPLATTEQALSQSWVQQVAGPTSAEAPSEPVVDADPLTGATERDYGTALTELEANARPVELPAHGATPNEAPLDPTASRAAADPVLSSEPVSPEREVSLPSTIETEAPSPSATPEEQIEALDPSDLVDPTDMVTDVAAPTRPAPTNPMARPVIESATLQRVEAAIEQLENTPPPRTLVLDLDDEHGTRIRVSSTADGVEVDVQSGNSDDAQAGWEQDLREQLAERGFELSGVASAETDDSTDVAGTTATRPADDALRI